MIILRNGVLAENYVSSVLLTQKEFGLVNNLRNKIAKRLSKSIESEISKREVALNTKLNKIAIDRKTRENIYKNANSKGARISRLRISSPQSPMTTTNKNAANLSDADDILYYNNSRRVRKLRKSAEKGNRKHQIIIPPHLKNIEMIPHETGHISNSESKNPITKLINSRATKASKESSRRFNMLHSKMGNHRKSGLKSVLQDIIDEECIISEERKASKKGLKELKKAGLNKRELEKAKENYKTALDTYKGKGRANWKMTLRNTIQTEDKRRGSFRDD